MLGLKVARWLGLCLLLAGFGCKDKAGEGDSGGETSVDSKALSGNEEDLLARRDSLLSARTRIRKARADLTVKRRELLQKGGDTSSLDAEETKLLAEERKLSEEESQLNKSLSSLLTERRQLVAQLSAQATTQNRAAARDTLMASRERAVADREARLSEREAALAARESAQAKREKETCGGGQPTIIQTVDARGSKYKKSDVEPMLKKARQSMSRKGILRSDLPAAVQGLEDEATAAMAKGDYGRAHFAANQLVRSVRGIGINKGFIAAKIGRLNTAIKGKKLGATKDAEVSKLFREATANFGDGRFKRANKRLNRIYGLIR